MCHEPPWYVIRMPGGVRGGGGNPATYSIFIEVFGKEHRPVKRKESGAGPGAGVGIRYYIPVAKSVDFELMTGSTSKNGPARCAGPFGL